MHRSPGLLWIVSLLFASTLGGAAEIPLRGRVAGAPVDGLRVRLEPVADRHASALLHLAGRQGPGAVDATSPGAGGLFELTAPGAGLWRVVAEAPGYRTTEYLLAPLVEPVDLPLLELERAVPVEVRVVDRQRPRAAVVAMFDREKREARPHRRRGWRRSFRVARTGDDGVARFARGAGETVGFEAVAGGAGLAAPASGDVTAGKAELELASGTGVTIRVTDQAGEPVAEALVFQVFQGKGQGEDQGIGQDEGRLPLGRTGSDGRVRLILSGEVSAVRILAADGASGTFEIGRGAGETSVALRPPWTLRGQVVDRDAGAPVAGAVIVSYSHRFATTDARGEATLALPVIEAGEEWLFLQAAAAVFRSARERWRLADGGPPELRFALPRTLAVGGIVVDSGGRPVPGADVHAVPARGAGARFPRQFAFHAAGWRARSAPDGRFALRGLTPGGGYEIVYEKQGFAPGRHSRTWTGRATVVAGDTVEVNVP